MRPPASSRDPARRAHRVATAGLVVLAATGAAWLLWRAQAHHRGLAAGGDIRDAVVAAAEELSAALPVPYAPGLVLETADSEGLRIIMTIRSEGGRDAAAARADTEALGAVQRSAHAELARFCDDPRMRGLMSRGLVLVRRFVDARGDLMFEVGLSANDCAIRPEPPST